jgi:phenylalanyl-tRNA synthetase beta chain
MHRATELVLEICGGTAGKIVDQRNDEFLKPAQPIALRRSRIKRLLGVSLDDEQVEGILKRLELTPEANDEGWLVSVPSHRFDIAIEADLIEEIARIYGYNEIKAKKSLGEMTMLATPEHRVDAYPMKRYLAAKGYQEAITYSFVDPELQQLMFPEAEAMRLMNPISSDMSDMRVSLMPGLVHTLQRNQSFRESRVRLFETGLRFVKSGDELTQTPGIAGLIYGPRASENWENEKDSVDFYDLKGDLEGLLELSGQHKVTFEAARHPALHPGQTAVVKINGEKAGYIGAIHPGIAQKIKLAGPVYLFEMDAEILRNGSIPAYEPWSKFPASTRDLAVVVDESVTASELLNTVREAGGKSLQKARIFDIYRGKGVDFGRKSVALGLIFCDFSTTLKDTEVNEVMSNIVDRLSETYQATLRD